jgi:hypothetical protein
MAAPSLDDLARSFERYLRAGNRSPRTIETDLDPDRTAVRHGHERGSVTLGGRRVPVQRPVAAYELFAPPRSSAGWPWSGCSAGSQPAAIRLG